tara:strand:- start:8264 stop:10291 length:2028 start_codon:yes stop_codon:yes gene_type:complete
MPTKLITQQHKLHLARQLIESISEIANTAYYVFASNHVARASSTVPNVTEDVYTVQIDPYRTMQFGKRVSANNARLSIRKINYTSNTLYAMYDDQDDELNLSDYYAIVNASSYYHVFLCLDNNRGANSTVEPDFSQISGSNTAVYQTSDGYRWKYLYTVSSTVDGDFTTDDWFPFEANTTVSNSAVDGAINIIKVDGTGSGYHNYVSGTFIASSIHVGGQPTIYRLSNTNINHTNGFYTGCILYLATGTGSGQYAVVNNYYTNSSGNYISADRELTTVPTNGTTWQVNPRVKISGYGRNIVNAEARALVNAYASNGIYRVEMLDQGSGYEFATANVIANSMVDITTPSIVRPIMSPAGGHGFDAASDLNCYSAIFSVEFSNSESNTISTNNSFQQIGIIKDPVFSNVNLIIASSNGLFIADELIYKINPVRLETNATINTTSSLVTKTGADFVNQFTANDFVYLKASNGTSHMLVTIHDIVNSSTINLNSNGFFACTETSIYQANVSSNAVFISQSNSTVLVINSVCGVITSNDTVIGISSGAKAIVNTVYRSGVNKNFNTFVQMTKLVGSVLSGSLIEDEYVYQGASYANSTASGRLHSANVNGGALTLYITSKTGAFTTGTVTGVTSLATATISTLYAPELVASSGEIIFLENISPVERQSDQTEHLQIVFSF